MYTSMAFLGRAGLSPLAGALFSLVGRNCQSASRVSKTHRRPIICSCSAHGFMLAAGPRARAGTMTHGSLLPCRPWVPHAPGAPVTCTLPFLHSGSVCAVVLAGTLRPEPARCPMADYCCTALGRLTSGAPTGLVDAFNVAGIPRARAGMMPCGRLLPCGPWVLPSSVAR